MPFEVEVICDSLSQESKRLTTMRLRYPKFIHGEFMTHRVFSRNASSSRAIPVAKLLEEVREDHLRAGPVYWGAEQKGMQSGAELSRDDRLGAQFEWQQAALSAVSHAERLVEWGVHKSIVNRVLEPFSHINVIVTATEWDNFFGLRLDRAAQPEMRHLAELMWRAYNESKATLLLPGQWHLPYVGDQDREDAQGQEWAGPGADDDLVTNILIKVSVGRCARVSYQSFVTGKRSTVAENIRLHDDLLSHQPIHASPAEHQATPDVRRGPTRVVKLRPQDRPGNTAWAEWCTRNDWERPDEHGNLVGWRQYRKRLPGEALAPLPADYTGDTVR